MASTGPSATGATGAEREPRHQEKGASSQIVIVDLDEAQPSHLVRRLRKGQGKLMARVERVVDDLVDAGTIKSTAQPVVIVVRELPSMPWSTEDDED
jgi:Family of unknown function (DUF6200)